VLPIRLIYTPCLNTHNVIVAPWFNYFQMTEQLKECDNILAEKAQRMINYKEHPHKVNEELWHKTDKSESQLKLRKENFNKIIDLLHLSYIYNLNFTQWFIHDFIESSMYNDHFLEMHDLFDMPVINTLVELALPLEKDDIHDIDLSQKSVFYFDEDFECRDELQKLSLDKINNNKDMLAWIISSHMERRANKYLREDNKSLKIDKEALMNTLGFGEEDVWRIRQQAERIIRMAAAAPENERIIVVADNCRELELPIN